MTPRRTAQREKFTPSTYSDVDVDSDSGLSDGQTPPPIPARKASTPFKKRSKLEKGIDPSNLIRTRPRRSTSSKPTASDEEDPNPKRQRVTRRQGHNPLNYDTRLHPLDRYTRPAHFAKVNKEYGRATQGSEHSETSDEDIGLNNDRDGDEASQVPQEPDSDTEEHDDAHNKEKPVTTFRNAKHASRPPLPSPSRRRSSRTLGRSVAPHYDMKIHPDYDRVHRPATLKAASRRRSDEHKSRGASAETDTASVPVGDDDTSLSLTVDGKNRLHRDDAGTKLAFSKLQAIAIPPLSKGKSSRPTMVNPHPRPSPRAGKGPLTAPPAEDEDRLQPLPNMSGRPSNSSPFKRGSPVDLRGSATALDFEDLSSLDSRLYHLQDDAPPQGETRPRSWDFAKQVLFGNGEISFDYLNSADGTNCIKARYEEVRPGIEAFDTSKPDPIDLRDSTLRHMESFSVFDQKCGSKYWRHYEDSLYRPISTSVKELGQVVETDDDDDDDAETRDKINGSYGPLQHDANGTGTSPWIVGADEVASGSSSPFYPSAGGQPIPNSKAGHREQSYIDLGDGDGDEEQTDADPDRTVVESMRDTAQSSDPVFSTQELTDLLSPVTEYVAEFRSTNGGTSNTTDIVLSDPASSESTRQQATNRGRPNPNFGSPEANVIKEPGPSKSPPRLLEAFQYVKQTSVLATDDFASSQHIDDPQTSTIRSKGTKRKLRNGLEVIIHEDTPNREAVSQNSISPKTDLPKENLEEEAAEYSSDIHMRTPTTQRGRQAFNTPPIARIAPGGNNKTIPAHLSFFNGPIRQLSPLA